MAAALEGLNSFLSNVVVEIINPIILLLAALAFVLFLWGVFNLIRRGGDSEARSEGRSAILWGLVGLVIVFGAYGIINIALESFGLDTIDRSI